MKRLTSLLPLIFLLLGCVESTQERVRFFAEDGTHLYRKGAYVEAGEQFRAALQLRPDDPELLYNLAQCREKQGQRREAEQIYERILVINPDHHLARHAMHVHLVEAGKRDAAKSMNQQWLEARPHLAGPYVEDGWLREQDGDLDSARGRYLQALEIEPRNVSGLNHLARLYERLNRLERAGVLYERSLEADPDQPEIRRRLEELRAQGINRPRPD